MTSPFRAKASNKSETIKALNDNNPLHRSDVDDESIGFFRGAIFGLFLSSLFYAFVILAFTAALSNGANAKTLDGVGINRSDIGPNNFAALEPASFHGLSARSIAVGSVQRIGDGDKFKVSGTSRSSDLRPVTPLQAVFPKNGL
jgi:hypothetical protein